MPVIVNLNNVETTTNKSSSYTASSTTTYANTKALVDGLATKLDATAERLLFQGSFDGTSFSDSTTYYFSGLDGLAAQTTQGLAKFGFNQNRTITKVLLTCSQGSNYSHESVSFYLREDSTTDNTITTTLDLNSVGANTSRVFSYTVNIAVLSASTYEFKVVTPAFATNGSNSRWIVQLYGY